MRMLFLLWGIAGAVFVVESPRVDAQTGGLRVGGATVDTARFAVATNGAIAAVADRFDGQFSALTAAGRPILSFDPGGLTSYSNLRVDGRTYTDNATHSPRTPPFTEALPRGIVRAESARVVFVSEIVVPGGVVRLEQEWAPMFESGYAFLRMQSTITNVSARTVTAGLQAVFDVEVGDPDGSSWRQKDVVLSADGVPVPRERAWLGTAVPAEWTGSVTGSTVTVRGRMSLPDATLPDAFVAGNWQYGGYLGAAAWDYTPSGRAIVNAAVLAQWDERSLPPGGSVTLATDVGYGGEAIATLACTADPVSLDVDSTGFNPNPVTLHTTVRNAGYFPFGAPRVRLSLPPDAQLAPGEIPEKTAPSSLAPSDSVVFSWEVYPAPLPIGRSLLFPVDLQDPSDAAVPCVARLVCPAIPSFLARPVCADTIRLALSGTGYGYDPNPFALAAEIDNVGTASLSLRARIALPNELEPVSGLDAPVLPDPLPPGVRGTALWIVRAHEVASATTVVYRAAFDGWRAGRDSCAGAVALPAVAQPPPCVSAGADVRGTEFWIAFPRNPYGNGVKQLALHIAAPVDARVHLDIPYSGTSEDLVVPRGTVARVPVAGDLDAHPPETVEARGMHIVSDVPVAVYGASMNPAHSEAFLALPLHALGTEYVTVGYNFDEPYEQIVIAGTADGTRVDVDPASFTSTGRPPRQPFSFALDRGQTVLILAGTVGTYGSLTGTIVRASAPVAVYAGAVSGWIPDNPDPDYGFLNPHFEQMIPTGALGTTYDAVPFRSRKGGDTFKVVAAWDSTDVRIGAATVPLARAGDAYEFLLTDPATVVATRPVLLAQFSNSALWTPDSAEYGDASMLVLAPVDRYSACHEFPAGFDDRFDSSFVTLVVPDGDARALTMDGRALPDSLFAPIPGSIDTYASIPVGRGTHSVETSDARGIGVTCYGFEWHDAYAYNAGFLTAGRGPVAHTPPALQGEVVVHGPYPQPAERHAELDVTCSAPTRCVVRLVDVLGRVRAVLFSGLLASGRRTVGLGIPAGLSGQYFLTIDAGGTRLVRPLLVRAAP